MAATLEIPIGTSGLSATVSLFPDGSDIADSSGTSLVEATNRKGYYTCSITGLSGLYLVDVLAGSTPVWLGWANMTLSGTVIATQSRDPRLWTAVADIQTRLPSSLTDDGYIKADAIKLNGNVPFNFDPAYSTVVLASDQSQYAPAKAGDPMSLTSEERDAIAAALLDLVDGVEEDVTLRQSIRLIAAVLVGKRGNSGTLTEQCDAIGSPGTARVVGNLDANGNGTPTLTP